MEEEVCELCEGEGYILEDEDDGEGHTMRGTNSRICPHVLKDEEDRLANEEENA